MSNCPKINGFCTHPRWLPMPVKATLTSSSVGNRSTPGERLDDKTVRASVSHSPGHVFLETKLPEYF